MPTPYGFNSGAKTYANVGTETGVAANDPHQLVLMLFDGALAAVHQAEGAMQTNRVADKGKAISKAIRILDEGLKPSVDPNAGGQLSARLLSLYDYMTMRLLQANLRNDSDALREVTKLLTDLRDAWTQIKPAAQQATATSTSAAAQQPAAQTATAQAAAAPTAAQPAAVPPKNATAQRFFNASVLPGGRTLATTA